MKKFPVRHGKIHHSVIMVKEEEIHCGENTKIKAGVILDASHGPIIIEEKSATTVIPPKYLVTRDLMGNLIIKKKSK